MTMCRADTVACMTLSSELTHLYGVPFVSPFAAESCGSEEGLAQDMASLLSPQATLAPRSASLQDTTSLGFRDRAGTLMSHELWASHLLLQTLNFLAC